METLETTKARDLLKTKKMAAFARYLRQHGLRKTMAHYGWRVFAFIFICYLVRDVALYIVIPWWIARSVIK